MFGIIGVFEFMEFVGVYFALSILKIQTFAKINGKILEIGKLARSKSKKFWGYILKKKKKIILIFIYLFIYLFLCVEFYNVFLVLVISSEEPALLWVFLLKKLETLASLNT